VTRVAADQASGKFRAELPQGEYSVRQGSRHTTLTALSGGIYNVDLRPDRAFDFKVSVELADGGKPTVRIQAEGAGTHTLEVKCYNLELREPGEEKISLRPGHDAEVVKHAEIVAAGTPWVIVVIPDGVLNEHREVTGINVVIK
jgi:hypothetical protein